MQEESGGDDPTSLEGGLSRLQTADRRWLLGLLSIALVVRLVSLAAYPLMDSTEARYGEIARKMATSGDWITPWMQEGVPFWGKPPLSFWLSAGSIDAFGVSAFAARLPSFLLALGMLGIAFRLMRRERGSDAGIVSCLVLQTTALFFVCSGAVVSDTALALSVTGAMAAFWHSGPSPGRRSTAWGYVLFAALGVGLLAKGPVVGPLVAIPICGFCAITGQWRRLRQLPWIGGTVLMLAIALPWYVAAEARTPGFLHYFVYGEHVLRFLDGSWSDERYGAVHGRPPGFIWLHLLAGGLPWAPWLAVVAWRSWRRRDPALGLRAFAAANPWQLYLTLWAMAPAIFFTPAGSVLATYLLPGMPAIALLVATAWSDARAASGARLLPARRVWPALAAGLPALAVLGLVYLNAFSAPARSQAGLLSQIEACGEGVGVAYWYKRPYSAEFYSGGQAREVSNPAMLAGWLRAGDVSFVVTRASAGLPADLAVPLVRLASTGSERHGSVLWGVANGPSPDSCRAARRVDARRSRRTG